MSIQVLFFDMYQTLVYTEIGDKKAVTEEALNAVFGGHATKRGIAPEEANQFAVQYKSAQDLFYRERDKNFVHHNFGDILLGVFKNVYHIDVQQHELEKMIYEFRKLTRGDTGVYQGIKETLEALSKEYTLILASYTQGVYSKKELEEFGIVQYFTNFVFSSEIGHKKSSDEFWKKCIDVSGVNASECCMVGDNLDEDMYMASKNGLATVWIVNPLTKDKNSHDVNPKYRVAIENIRDLPEIIRGIH